MAHTGLQEIELMCSYFAQTVSDLANCIIELVEILIEVCFEAFLLVKMLASDTGFSSR